MTIEKNSYPVSLPKNENPIISVFLFTFVLLFSSMDVRAEPSGTTSHQVSGFIDSFNNHFQWGRNKKDIEKNTSEIRKNQKTINDNSKKLNENRSKINLNEDKINENRQLIDNNERNTIINEKNIKRHGAKINDNSEKINKNRNDIAFAGSLINEHSLKIDEITDRQQQFEKKTASHFSTIDKRIGENHHKAMAGISSAMAMTAIPFVEGKRFSFGLGAGSYGGQGASALGSKMKLTSNINASAFASYDTTHNIGAAAGISIGW